MPSLTANDWYTTLAAMDTFNLGLWSIAVLLLVVLVSSSRLIKIPRPLKRQIPRWISDKLWYWLIPAATGLRLPRLLTDSLWYDETFTGVVSQLNGDDFLTVLSADVHPPLYYLLAKLSTSVFGYNDIALRLPSLAAGIALLPAMFYLTKALTGKRSTAQIATVIVAILPAMIHYSSEARYPIVLALVVVTGMLAIIKRKPVLFAYSGSAAVLLHATGIVYAGVLIIAAFIRFRKKRIWWLAIGVIGLTSLAYIYLMAFQAGDLANGFWLWQMLPMDHVILGSVGQQKVPEQILIYIPIMLVTLATSMAVPRSYRLIWLLVATGVPITLFAIGLVWQPVYLPRALLASVLMLVISWATLASRRLYRWLLIVAIVSALLMKFTDREGIDLRELFQRCEGSEIVYTSSTNMGMIALHYAPENTRTLNYINGNNQHQELTYEARRAMGFNFAPVDIIDARICAVVGWNYYTTDVERQHVIYLKERFKPESELIEESAFFAYEVLTW